MKILLSGASGFIGSALIPKLIQKNFYIYAISRKNMLFTNENLNLCIVKDLREFDPIKEDISQIDVVIHLAGRAHILKDNAENPLSEFFNTNVEGTIHLARCAAKLGAKRFIFLSSIGVNGGQTYGSAFTELTKPDPISYYAISKFEAEERLKKMAAELKMEFVIIRPPLVYGVNAPGNFNRLIKIISNQIPLPLASIKNKRSFVCIDNLVDFITLCINHKNAGNQTFLISDGISVSTPELIKLLSKGLGKQSRLFPFPNWLLKLAALILKKDKIYQQLAGSLEIDSSKASQELGWSPTITMEQYIKDYMSNSSPD